MSVEICPRKLVNVVYVNDLESDFFDGICIISESLKCLENYAVLTDIYQLLDGYAKFNRSVDNRGQVSSVVDPTRGKLIVFSCTGSSYDDFDDVRKFRGAGEAASKFVLSAGLHTPLFIVVPSTIFPNAQLLGMLGVFHALYVPLSIRRLNNDDGTHKVIQIGLHLLKDKEVYSNSSRVFVQLLNALQCGFQVCRDVGDSDPIHMTPKNVAAYVQKYFDSSSSVTVSVTDNEQEIADDFPLVAAVNRGANAIEDHKARLIWLEYVNEEKPSTNLDFETLCLVGKGVTLDTGGLDIKTGGAMFGMSRDKYGSAVVAGFFAVLDALKPKGIKVRACMCMVRNSVDAGSYSCDEIITARSGKRIHIQNTDAEGRIAMLDALTYYREQASKEKNPHLMTLATLTGHCVLSYGHCSAIMDNGPARALCYAENLQKTGDLCGQPVEISRLYSEDFQFHCSETEAAHLRQANTKPSVQTVRGHMTPAAFLIRGSGLDENGTNSNLPIQFTHVDIGSSMGTYPGVTFPNPLLTLVMHHIVPRVF